MKKLSLAQIKKIETINGTMDSRNEYLEAIANLLGLKYGSFKYDKNDVARVIIDDSTILDIKTKNVNGVKMITSVSVLDYANNYDSLIVEKKKDDWIAVCGAKWYIEEEITVEAEEVSNIFVGFAKYIPNKYRHMFYTFSDEQNVGDGYWGYLKNDYICKDTGSHTVHEWTLKDFLKSVRTCEKIN